MDFDFLSEEDLRHHTQSRLLGWEQANLEFEQIKKGGSDRRYYRVTAPDRKAGPASVILMVYTTRRPDNVSYFPATVALQQANVRCPRVYAHDADHMIAWVEDMGPEDLYALHENGSPERLHYYKDALTLVGKLHAVQETDLPSQLQQSLQPPFDQTLYLWEQNYFFDNFAHAFSALTFEQIETIRHSEPFHQMAEDLASLPRFLVHRDFQSQNIMTRGGVTFFIDHQGLRPGRPEYDVASLLYDPYVPFSEEEREELENHYFTNHPGHNRWDSSPTIYAQCACQRLMQALGAYGNLGLNQGKVSFLKHIPAAITNLRGILAAHPDLLPGLESILELRKDLDLTPLFSPTEEPPANLA